MDNVACKPIVLLFPGVVERVGEPVARLYCCWDSGSILPLVSFIWFMTKVCGSRVMGLSLIVIVSGGCRNHFSRFVYF